MKKTFFYMMMIVFVVLPTGCNKEDGTEPEPEPEFETTYQITMLTLYPDVTISLAGYGIVTIDWGDKTPMTVKVLREYSIAGWQSYDHSYTDAAATHTITINGNGMTWFSCINTGTIQLDVSKNPVLDIMSCADNHLSSLDVSHNIALRTLFCAGNHLNSLDLKNNSRLINLECYSNELSDLDVSRNKELEYLACYNNKLTKMDISNNPKLIHLQCMENELLDLDVSNNTELEVLLCYDNLLTKLDISANNKLFYLGCMTNDLSSQSLNELFETLHNNTIPTRTKGVFIYGNPGIDDCDTSIATSKGWIVNKSISSLNL